MGIGVNEKVLHRDDDGHVYTWDGGHGVHHYIGDQEIGYCSVGDWSQNAATEDEAREAVEEALHDPEHPLNTG